MNKQNQGVLHRWVDRMAQQPVIFDALRWILEAGFRGEKRILRREKMASYSRILDLGCGTGALAGEFERGTYWGVDPNPAYVRRAKRIHPGHYFFRMDGGSLAFHDEAFEAVLISGVIHHLEDVAASRILSEVRRVLKIG